MEEMSGRQLASAITKVLQYLKEHKISQYEIERQLNYTSLSKAKNFERYPQSVIEKKTRSELLARLLEEYGLMYDEKSDRVQALQGNTPLEPANVTLHYIMYYYAFARETIGKAIIKIVNKKRVYIDYPLNEHWEGTYDVVENYTFIYAEKMGDATPVKKLICLFSGTERYGRPILLGTYSTVKRDGFPAAGSILLEKLEDLSLLEQKIRAETDPRIEHYLLNKVFISDSFTPNNLDSLKPEYSLIKKYADLYKVFFRNKKEVLEGQLKLGRNGKADLMVNEIQYAGSFHLLDPHTIEINLTDISDFTHIGKESFHLLIKTNQSKYAPFYLTSCIGNGLDSAHMLFECLTIAENKSDPHTRDEARSLLLKS